MSNRSPATITSKEKSSMPMRSSLIQRKCACENSAGMAGECRDCQKKSLVQRKMIDQDNTSEVPPIAHEFPIQTKLTVGKPGDIYEQEADRVATQVMSMGNSSLSIQPATAIGKKAVQTKRSSDGESQAGSNIESQLSSSKGGGSPLPDDVRSFMEPRFNSEFSHVRVHTDARAIQMNQDLNAQAFTHQQDIYFGAGKLPAKDSLTAHELTHIVQQTSNQSQPVVQRQGKTSQKNKKPHKKNPHLTFEQVKSHVESNNNSTVSAELLICMIWKESGFDPTQKNSASSATGLMQMTKGAVEQVNKSTPKGIHFTHGEMTDPAKNIACGTYYLSIRIEWAKGDIKKGLEGYGTGAGYADNIQECETCLQKNPNDPNSCLLEIHK
jgi:hypothetical protein